MVKRSWLRVFWLMVIFVGINLNRSNPKAATLNLYPYALNPTPRTLHRTSRTLHPTSEALNYKPYTLLPASYTLKTLKPIP
jgi:hypothetical protein